jgi:hypothetical protein
MNSIEISYSAPFDNIKIYVNQTLVAEANDVGTISSTFNYAFPVKVEVEFAPFKIKPIVRFNNFMLNYWLADILLQDHKLEFSIGENFYQDYKNKDIAGRIAHLSMEEKSLENMYDKYIGINNLYPELVKETKELLK